MQRSRYPDSDSLVCVKLQKCWIMHFPAVTDSLFLFDPLCPRVPSVEHRLPVRNERSTIPEMRFLGDVT